MSFTYPNNLKFECNKCGICCGDTKEKVRHILLLDAEMNKISEITALIPDDFCCGIEGKEPYVFEMKKNSDGKCLFLKDNNCTIYAHRPLICRFYPFELNFDNDLGKYQFNFTVECPGLGSGQEIRDVDFKKLLELAEQRLLNNEQ